MSKLVSTDTEVHLPIHTSTLNGSTHRFNSIENIFMLDIEGGVLQTKTDNVTFFGKRATGRYIITLANQEKVLPVPMVYSLYEEPDLTGVLLASSGKFPDVGFFSKDGFPVNSQDATQRVIDTFSPGMSPSVSTTIFQFNVTSIEDTTLTYIGTSTNYILSYNQTNGTIDATVNDVSAMSFSSSIGDIENDGIIHTVVFVSNTTYISFYVDGIHQNTLNYDQGEELIFLSRLEIGGRSPLWNYGWQGNAYQCLFYSSVLSDDEIMRTHLSRDFELPTSNLAEGVSHFELIITDTSGTPTDNGCVVFCGNSPGFISSTLTQNNLQWSDGTPILV